jgi:hypothetical protein
LITNLNFCDKECYGCIKDYKSKHDLKAGEKFKISCSGIPKEYISKELLNTLPEEEVKTALSIVDPVTWAAINLDWHCSDPNGEIWKRKDPQEYETWRQENPGVSIYKKSRYHRPYQQTMLRCKSKSKVFRAGRQIGKTESLCVSILFHIFTKPGKPEKEGFTVAVITPYISQIELIFKRLNELIDSNPSLSNSVQQTTKSPNHKIVLTNQSMVIGYTAGTKSGGHADSARGGHCDMLVYDESDLLAREDIDSTLAMITNYPNATVWMSSTPTGKRERFFENCNSRFWKEFHYPSCINPLWTKELEDKYKEQMTTLGYQHDIEANFGEQEQGVFQNAYVQEALDDYEYQSIPWHYDWVYTIGVDWNDVANGTNIYVIGYNPHNNHFYGVDCSVVSKAGWTQSLACERVIELNRIWKPSAIYIDKGFGHMQDEVLRKYGWDALIDPQRGATHPDSRLRDVVKQYEFGSTIEVHDFFTKQPIKKPAKPFLVENAVRRFETKLFSFPKSDKHLISQLGGYVIDHVSSTGAPVYKAKNKEAGDHMLDAMMLALVGFTLEKTPLGHPIYTTKIAFAPRFGEGDKNKKVFEDEAAVIIKDDKPRDIKKQYYPEMKRTEGISQDFSIIKKSSGLPGNNVNIKRNESNLWAWDGFMSDRPRPVSNGFNRKPGRPTRKNI